MNKWLNTLQENQNEKLSSKLKDIRNKTKKVSLISTRLLPFTTKMKQWAYGPPTHEYMQFLTDIGTCLFFAEEGSNPKHSAIGQSFALFQCGMIKHNTHYSLPLGSVFTYQPQMS